MTTTAIPKPRTFHADLAHLPAALLPLTKLNRWVIWRWEMRKDRWTKPPFQPCFHNEPAKSNTPSTWGSYEDAVLAFTQGLCEGIGVMLKGSELAAIDLDHVRDFATGQVLPWAEELFAEAANAGCYVEWTVLAPVRGSSELRTAASCTRRSISTARMDARLSFIAIPRDT